MRRPKKDTSHMMRQTRDGFAVNEWLEALIRCRDEQPRRYAREVSAGLQVTVERYAELKAAHELREAA